MAEKVTPLPTASKKRRVTLQRPNDLNLTTACRYLVARLIPLIGLVVVWGPPKCGKSFWIFDMLMHIAIGWQYRGRRVQQGPVVYCAFEGQFGLKTRLAAFKKHFGVALETTPIFFEMASLNLVQDHVALIEAIRENLGTQNPACIALDTLNRSISGSENNDEDMTAYIAAADALKETFNCAVLVIHHCGIQGNRPRGHTALTGAADVQIKVKLDKQGCIVSEVELAKDGPQGDTIVSSLHPVDLGKDDAGEPITSMVVVPADDKAIARARVDKLRPKTKLAYECFLDLVDKQGTAPPAGVPVRHILGVTEGVFRQALCDAKVINSESGYREQFKRHFVTLISQELLKVSGDFVWASQSVTKA